MKFYIVTPKSWENIDSQTKALDSGRCWGRVGDIGEGLVHLSCIASGICAVCKRHSAQSPN